MNKKVQAEDKKRALAAKNAPVVQPTRQKKHKSRRSPVVNLSSVTVAEGALISGEGSVPQRPSLAQVNVADVVLADVPLPKRSKGINVPVIEKEDPGVYRDGEHF